MKRSPICACRRHATSAAMSGCCRGWARRRCPPPARSERAGALGRDVRDGAAQRALVKVDLGRPVRAHAAPGDAGLRRRPGNSRTLSAPIRHLPFLRFEIRRSGFECPAPAAKGAQSACAGRRSKVNLGNFRAPRRWMTARASSLTANRAAGASTGACHRRRRRDIVNFDIFVFRQVTAPLRRRSGEAMKSGLAFGWEDRRASATIFGDALGLAVLALSLLAVALPLVGTAYLDRYLDAGAPLPAAKLRLSPALSQPIAPALAPPKLAETRSGASAAGSDATGAVARAAPAPIPAKSPANPPVAAADQIVGIAFPQARPGSRAIIAATSSTSPRSTACMAGQFGSWVTARAQA